MDDPKDIDKLRDDIIGRMRSLKRFERRASRGMLVMFSAVYLLLFIDTGKWFNLIGIAFTAFLMWRFIRHTRKREAIRANEITQIFEDLKISISNNSKENDNVKENMV